MNEINNTIKLQRFPFSIFLLPVSLFPFFYIQHASNYQLFLVLAIWLLLVFPYSNGYNSYQDQDEGQISVLAFPPKPSKVLLHLSNILDAAAILFSFLVNNYFVFLDTVYLITSRLYIHRNDHLKKFPTIGFLIVFIFQGTWIFCANIFELPSSNLLSNQSVIFSAIASSFFIATIYPLTQIYQHEADQKDDVKTLSMLLSTKDTLIFSMFMFSIATFFIYQIFHTNDAINNFWIINIMMLPATIYFLFWMLKSFKNAANVNFKNTLVILLFSSLLNNIFFLILLYK